MPYKTKRVCPGCRKAVLGKCTDCAKKRWQQQDEHRGTATQRGYTSQWTRAAKGFLRSHPLCAICLKQGKVEAAEVVDHIIPHKGDMALFWDYDNWQALSKRCHDRKTATEDGGFGNYRS